MWPWTDEFCILLIATDLVCLGEDGAHDGDDVGLMGEMLEAEYELELLKANYGGCSRHEPDYRRV